MSTSLVTRAAVGVQSAKGTAATANFHAMRLTRSSVVPVYDLEEALNEHTGVHQRASNRQTTADRISQRHNVSLEGFLYPNAIGTLLVGMGFNAQTTDNTTYKTHAFTKANVDAAKYISIMHALLAGSARFERKIKDVRLTQLQLVATRQNIRMTAQGLGLDELTSTGTETVANEINERILPVTGSMALGTLALGEPRSHTVTITRPVDEDDQKLHSTARADVPETGFEINGEMQGLDLSFNTYKKLVWGGTSGTAPSMVAVTDTLTTLWESARDISGASVPYSLQIALLKAEFRFSNFEAQGNNIVRCDASYHMIDDASGAPATISLANGVTSY
ncbi:MAG: hypothetical protein IT328_20155 [Caldilineaceae bacterium]|nr:hypothetical protein [Caldilineaceae bacterium]